MNCKLYIGCVSRNTVDAVIDYSIENNVFLGLIPSRRQVDFDGGYIGFDNKTLHKYVKSKTDNVILQRDHGGPYQGKHIDDGVVSLINDCQYYDLIHIDPWKLYGSFDAGLYSTLELMNVCLHQNYKGGFEIATEQAIRQFSLSELDRLIESCRDYNITYVVIQSGTSLKENVNTGVYDQTKLVEFIKIVRKHGLKSKEHNGDYLPTNLIHEKFRVGLDSINIAPEFGLIETNCYIKAIGSNNTLLNKYYQLCHDSGQWKKWVDKNFDVENRHKLIQICGHYILETDAFRSEIKEKLPDITTEIRDQMKQRINEILQ